MTKYEKKIEKELNVWRKSMQEPPSLSNKATKEFQVRFNRMIPEKIHQLITKAVKGMTRAVLFGADFTTLISAEVKAIEDIEIDIKDRINFYCSSAAAEGAVTGFGGFVSGLADFPLWMTLKMKMLFEIASYYGYNTKDLTERIFILHVFEITFSSQLNRNKVYETISNWRNEKHKIPSNIDEFDWRKFQIEYRDHLDVAKLMQLIPGFGAVVGAYVNHKYTKRLGDFAMNAYRMRNFKEMKNK